MSVHWLAFVSLALAGYVSPGPDTAMILRSSVGGRRVALAAAAGSLSGLSVHMLIGAVGLSAVLVAVPGSLTALSLIGAAYLAYLGVRALVGSGRTGASPLRSSTDLIADVHCGRRAFRNTLITNLTNPKVILFFVAVLPQFVDRSSAWPIAVQLGILGTVDVLIGVLYLPILVMFGARAFHNLGSRGLAKLELGVGVVLLLFAGALIVDVAVG